MKTSENSDDLLVFEETPWGVAALLLGTFALPFVGGLYCIFALDRVIFGVGVIAVGALVLLPVFYVFVRRTQLVFDRPGGVVRKRVQTIFGDSETICSLRAVRGAEVDTLSPTENGKPERHRMVVRTASGEDIRFPKQYTPGGGAQRNADLVNGWLHAV
ncbi:hypothetical protein [Histidinibacterium aquaticum]|uniref:Uncharacterized protein n=1 Tax=Histidinibacterium aquaticum TaxID=2613962 RepID=A0A5J5GCY2_9RHOB|nr:hypothetical protein [Histidinibacterium aquaticum]KAA9006025.1 hypothetical protein F3S47_15850 [Histidinibacterium aquaticum]